MSLADTSPCLGQLALLCCAVLAVAWGWLALQVRDLAALCRQAATARPEPEQMTELLLLLAHHQQRTIALVQQVERLDSDVGAIDTDQGLQARQLKVLRKRERETHAHLAELARQQSALLDLINATTPSWPAAKKGVPS